MFVHLHNHTHYSLLDGLSRPKECVSIAKKQGAPAIAITDHGVLYGVIEFYQAALEAGIKPIIGCEIYIAPEGRFKKEPGTKINHMILLAETTEGYKNLIQLTTKAHLEGFYYKPRVDHGLLRAYHGGLIALSGCLMSETSQAIISGKDERAIEIIKMYQEVFGKENFFLELQDHPRISDQTTINRKLIELAKETNAPLVATNDSHYARKEDRDAHDILLCIQTGKSIRDQDRMKYEDDYSIRSPEEMIATFQETPEAIQNTLEIANRCNVEITFHQNLLPSFTPPQGKEPSDYLRERCEEGLKKRYGEKIDQDIRDRLEYELSVIHKSGFDTYFLIVHDFVNFAKEKGVIVGPGRGSAAGSLVSYALFITDVDPLKYGLLFERFLNPERVSMPDIDIDFDDERRDEVLEYVVQKYGRENVAQIITFGTMAARAAVRDVGRAMGYPYGEVDRIAKFVPPPVQGRHIPLEKSIKEDPVLRKIYEEDPRAKALLDNAITLEGTVRHAGTHACAVVMSKEPLTHVTPLQNPSGEEKAVITQYSMKPIEDLGLLKMDFLGLRNLTVIDQALKLVEKTHGVKIDLNTIPLDDRKTFELLSRGETTGVFQLESGGMKKYLKDLKPNRMEDIIAMIALYRPGPMPWIPMYIRGKHEPEKVMYLHESFVSTLKETYGVAVYQEQILEIARAFAGFTLGEADILRKAVGKKDPKLLMKQQEKFIQGAIAKGHSKKFAENVFQKVIEPFAAYGFNKSHATCYAFIAYHTAYLKANYPVEFMAALLTSDSENVDRVVIEVQECEAMGISVLPPSVNESYANFTVVDQKTIRFGLTAIKGVGDASVNAIIQAREKTGSFKSLEDFAARVLAHILNKKLIEALALSGAMDEFGERKAIAGSTEEIVQYARQTQSIASDGQLNIFGLMSPGEHEAPEFHLKKFAESTRFERLAWEKELLGLYVSGHPLQGLRSYMMKKYTPIESLSGKSFVGKTTKIAGLVTKVKKIVTKSGSYMAYLDIEDVTGTCEITVFPKLYQAIGSTLSVGQMVVSEGKVEFRGDQVKFLANALKNVSLDDMTERAKAEGLSVDPPYIIELDDRANQETLASLKTILQSHRGERQVVIHVPLGRTYKQIKVPFGVDVNEELKEQLRTVL